jgi:hypothetical protein
MIFFKKKINQKGVAHSLTLGSTSSNMEASETKWSEAPFGLSLLLRKAYGNPAQGADNDLSRRSGAIVDPRLSIILQKFDLKRLNRMCNERGCRKPPSKKTMIFEANKLTSERKELVLLNLCTGHFAELKRFLRDLDELTGEDKAIVTETFETGYVTH